MAKSGVLQVKILGDSKPLEKTLSGLGGKLAKFGVAAAAAGVAAIAGLAAFSVKTFADFDAAMTESTAIMGDVSDAMRNDMAMAARDVAKTTKFSAKEAAEAYFFLASAGLDAEQSIAALPMVAAFAQAGMFDLATATDLLTDAQSALGMTSDDATQNLTNMARVSDVLVKANTLANASVEQFAEALTSKAGNALQVLGKDVEEGVAALAVFADQGIKGERAGTLLTNTLFGLTDRARASAEGFDKLGISVFDSEGEMRNMALIIGDFEAALGPMTTQQQVATLAQLGFNKQAREGLLALMGNSEQLAIYEASLRDAAGTTQEVAENQMQTFWAQLGLVKDNLIDIALTIGQALMPALMAFVDWLTANLPSITEWFATVGQKFNDLLGITGVTMQGATVEMAGMADAADRAMLGTAASLDYVHVPFANFQNAADIAMLNSASSVAGFRQSADSDFTEAGTLMGRMYQAWLIIWEEDIKPWFQSTLIPWFHEVVTPALIEWAQGTGAAMGKALLDGLNAAFVNAFEAPGRFVDAQLAKIPGLGFMAPKDTRPRPTPTGEPPNRTSTYKPPNAFHDGGIVPGRRGQEVPILAMAGETVLPTHKQSSTNGLHIENLYVGTADDARYMTKELQKASMVASYG